MTRFAPAFDAIGNWVYLEIVELLPDPVEPIQIIQDGISLTLSSSSSSLILSIGEKAKVTKLWFHEIFVVINYYAVKFCYFTKLLVSTATLIVNLFAHSSFTKIVWNSQLGIIWPYIPPIKAVSILQWTGYIF